MSIGYACITLGVPGTGMKGCIQRNADEARLTAIISHNLAALKNALHYMAENGIRLFRISSDLIPFGSSPVNQLPWKDMFAAELLAIGDAARKSGIRLSMHPGQYTLLNSPDETVVSRAVDDLSYHARVLDSMGLSSRHKIVLHIGGIYQNKKQAITRFVTRYHDLSESVKKRLVLENDDSAYTIGDVLDIGRQLSIPVVFDNLHHRVNSCDPRKSEGEWIRACKTTWRDKDGRQKVHYAEQDPNKRPGAHAESISIGPFMDFYAQAGGMELDIMLEVKDKNLSALKCILCTADSTDETLRAEWNRYAYRVLEKSPEDYQTVLSWLSTGNHDPETLFRMIERAMQSQETPDSIVGAAQKIWHDCMDHASQKNKASFDAMLDNVQQGKASGQAVHALLSRMAAAYDRKELLRSYYFVK